MCSMSTSTVVRLRRAIRIFALVRWRTTPYWWDPRLAVQSWPDSMHPAATRGGRTDESSTECRSR